MKHFKSIILVFILLPVMGRAEGGLGSVVYNFIVENIIVLLALAVIVIAFVALFNLIMQMMNFEQNRILMEKGIEVEKDTASSEGFFSRMYDKLVDLKPLDKEQDIQLDHDYDGIHELDNNLPPWWLYLFYFTVIFGAGYLYLYMFTDIGVRQHEEYEIAMEEAEEQKLAYLALQSNSVDETSVTLTVDAGDLDKGKSIFVANCAACHGQLGEGGVGPSFADQYWIHGGDVKDLFKTIKYGVPEKGMISWQSQLRPNDIRNVASYILTLEGTDPPNQKDKQGVFYDRSAAKVSTEAEASADNG